MNAITYMGCLGGNSLDVTLTLVVTTANNRTALPRMD